MFLLQICESVNRKISSSALPRKGGLRNETNSRTKKFPDVFFKKDDLIWADEFSYIWYLKISIN
jgi:hypothetical protein